MTIAKTNIKMGADINLTQKDVLILPLVLKSLAIQHNGSHKYSYCYGANNHYRNHDPPVSTFHQECCDSDLIRSFDGGVLKLWYCAFGARVHSRPFAPSHGLATAGLPLRIQSTTI